MLDSIPKVTDRRKRAAELIESLLKMLRAGWSPWVNVDDNRGYTPLSELSLVIHISEPTRQAEIS